MLPANLVKRAVIVPPGATSVTMHFEPFCRTRNVVIFWAAAFAAAAAISQLSRLSTLGSGMREGTS